MIRRLWALMVKEFLAIWKDPRTRMVVLVPPVIQVLIFAFAATFDVRQVPLAVWNEDGTSVSRELVRRFAGSDAFRIVARVDGPAAVRAVIDRQTAAAVLHIGQRFSAELATGRPAPVQLLIDGRRSNSALIVQNYAADIVAAYDRSLAGAAGGRSLAGTLGQAGPTVAVRAWFNPNLESRWFILPGLNVLLAMITAMLLTALSVARERELGTFDQLLVTPLRPVEIMIGKVLPPLAIGLFEAVLILGLAVFAFGVPFVGSPAWLALGFVVFLVSAIGIGLAISALATTQQQAILGVFMYLTPAIVLSGFATPIENMPGWCRLLSRANPLRYMLDLSRGLYLRAPPASVILGDLWPMALIGLVTLAAATWLFRHRLE